MSLASEIKKWSAKVQSDAYSMSFGELINLYENKELDIHPEFQRFFRWDLRQKSRLVESILLGIPLPSIFVAQRKDGVWDVIDGLQRLSTIFQLVGVLKDEKNKPIKSLVLEGTKYLPSLEGKKWSDSEGEGVIGSAERLFIKRAKIDVKIIKKESDESSKYELFQRLNTGGSQLSDQEVRNCILISIDPEAYKAIRALTQHPSFAATVALTDRALDEQFDMELALRFLLLVDLDIESIRKIGDVGEFLTDTMVEQATNRKLVTSKKVKSFERTFDTIEDALGDQGFHRYDSAKKKFVGGFLLSGFEAVAVGLGNHMLTANWDPPSKANIRKKVEELWGNAKFLDGIGSGVRASQRLPVSIPLGRTLLKNP